MPGSNREQMIVYPNPSRGKVYISPGTRLGQKDIIKIVDLNGRIVQVSENLPGSGVIELDITELDRGIYILQFFRSGCLRSWTKIIKIDPASPF